MSKIKEEESILKHFKGAFITSFIIFLIIFGMELANGGKFTLIRAGIYLSITLLYGVSIFMVNVLFSSFLDRKLFWKDNPVKRFIYGVLASLVISTIIVLIINLFLGVVFFHQTAADSWNNVSIEMWMFYWGITLIIALFYHGVDTVRQLVKAQEREQQLTVDHLNAQYSALKAQLDPHFLFNSLNVLSSLVDENPGKAQDFINGLSNIYRYVLEKKDSDWVPLKEEVNFAKAYLELLKMRFEEGLDFSIEVGDSYLNYHQILPLSLQLLLENAVKHNVADYDSPLRLRLFIEDNYIVVQNNYNPRKTRKKSTKLGLNTIINRYDTMTEKQVVIENTAGIYRVKLPLM